MGKASAGSESNGRLDIRRGGGVRVGVLKI